MIVGSVGFVTEASGDRKSNKQFFKLMVTDEQGTGWYALRGHHDHLGSLKPGWIIA